jgi:hypothetical protein
LWIGFDLGAFGVADRKGLSENKTAESAFLVFESPFLSAWPAKQATQVDVFSVSSCLCGEVLVGHRFWNGAGALLQGTSEPYIEVPSL